MLRDVFVVAIIAFGFIACWKGPFYSLLFYLWLAYFRPEQWVWNDWVTAGHFSLIVGVIVVVQTLFATPKLRLNRTTGLLVLFLAQSLLSTMVSLDWDWSWQWWPEFSKVILIGCLIMIHGNTDSRLRTIFLVIALSLGFEEAKQGWVDLFRHPGALNMNEHPVLGDNNGVAMGLFMLAPIFGALARTTERWWEKSVYWVFAVGVILRGFTTYSRGGFLAAGALGIVYILQSRYRVRTAIVVAVLATSTLAVMPSRFWDRMDTITASDEDRDASAQGRIYFWSLAVRMAQDHPFAGVGFNAYRKAFNDYDTADHSFGFFRAVHSTWFGVVSEMGVPGLLLLVTVLLQAAWNCRRALRRARDDTSRTISRELARALLGSLVVFVVAGTFLNAQYSEMLWHFVCLAAAVRWAGSGSGACVFEPEPARAALEPSLMDSIAGASHA